MSIHALVFIGLIKKIAVVCILWIAAESRGLMVVVQGYSFNLDGQGTIYRVLGSPPLTSLYGCL